MADEPTDAPPAEEQAAEPQAEEAQQEQPPASEDAPQEQASQEFQQQTTPPQTQGAEPGDAPPEEAPQEDAPQEDAQQEQAPQDDAPQEAPTESATEAAPAEDTAPDSTQGAGDQDATEGDTEKPSEEQTGEPTEDQVTEPATEDAPTTDNTAPPPTEDQRSGTVQRENEPDVDPHAPSPEPKFDRDATATVKFVLMPSGQVATMRCGLGQTLAELKQHFATELKIPSSMILFMFDGSNMEDRINLADLGVGPNGTVQLEMQSADPVNTPLKGFRPKQEYHMPDVITVRVNSESGGFKDIVVEIERPMRKKPFLGGYRHKETGQEFHHAAAQTVQKPRPPPVNPRFCRDTQTVEQKHIVQQTANHTATQMTKIGVYVSNMEDKLMAPGKYTTADDFHANILSQPGKRKKSMAEEYRDFILEETGMSAEEYHNYLLSQSGMTEEEFNKLFEPQECKDPDAPVEKFKAGSAEQYKERITQNVVTIQKYYRRWLARRYVQQVRTDQEERKEWERQEEIRKKQEKENRIKREFERRMNPKTKEDFDLLYHALEKWRQEEEERINATLTGAERKAALCVLLERQTQLIASIGRHKLDSDLENRDKRIMGFLNKAAAAKKWKGPDGQYTQMDTPYTLRAAELRDIYSSINMKYLTMDERLDVLLTLKHTVKEHDCKLTQDIIELIDREADLLMRGVKDENMEGLRRRISTLFLQYIKTPTFNPEAARLLKVPQDPSVLRKNIYYCPSCNQYLPSTEFHLSSNSRSVGRCRKCDKIDNDGRVRQDYSHYRFMLKALRRTEDAYADGAMIAFLMQENDLRYLVENVWSSQSLLSAWEDLYDLVLVRWDRFEEWAPWNCILLTKEEATAHEKLENLTEAYGKTFVHKVKHKHALARNYFSRLPGMAQQLRSRKSGEQAPADGPSVSGQKIVAAQ